MRIVLFGLAMTGVGVLAFRASRDHRRLRALTWVVAVLFCMPTTLFVGYYTHLVDSVLYFEWRSWPWTDYLAPLGGFVTGMLAAAFQNARTRFAPNGFSARDWTVTLVAGSTLTVLLLLVAFARPLLRPMPLDQIQDRWKQGVCLQSTPATCGPCAAATALNHLDYDISERKLAREAVTDTGGTLNWLLVRAIRARGIKAEISEPNRLSEVQPPAIIGVTLPGGVGHFLAYLGRQDGRYLLGEPLAGPLMLSDEDFSERYRFQHFAVEFRK